MEVQIFGVRKSADTRKALRFFAERRVKTHFVDLMERPASKGELRRFIQKLGPTALIDQSSKRYRELGLRHARLSGDSWLEKLANEPMLLRMPLVRNSSEVSIGADEATWKKWMER
jgi:arsenate reductase-like glutaredoxin family protein